MKICLIFEGSYPYVRGGVSSWADDLIHSMPEHEFILWTIGDFEKRKGKFKYELPKNVTAIHENFLDSALKMRVRNSANIRFSNLEKEALSNLIRSEKFDWQTLHSIFHKQKKNPVEFFMSEDFLNILKSYVQDEFPFAGFSNLFWTIRSMYLPLLYLIRQPYPEADLYHSVSTGYAGVLGSLASLEYKKPFVITEHGIYTREREEEILYSEWINPYFKSMWISMFNMYASFAYDSAQIITSLYNRAKTIQQELGCKLDNCKVISNGIMLDKFTKVQEKQPDDWIDIGAIVRFAPIKDIKTLIYTFSSLKEELHNARLHILGPIDDEAYYQECLSLIRYLNVRDVIIPGEVNTKEYLQRLDFTVLTSISEGQPLSIIESMAAARPVIATNVGCCKELINGDEGDNLGQAGICVPPMHQSELLKAMVSMCQDVEMRKKMGHVARRRAINYYDHTVMVNQYNRTYEEATRKWQELALS
ncbi:MAG: GT4 family glycosyltransferase PelF [Anaerolineae bacterium]|nr:GT4 family glycosyltransferase PelF [Anaerolineae bacterium]